jgi:2-polyprenyl-6-methoxyphenol hydroxylase-like FAD-dependent oxidoreductase
MPSRLDSGNSTMPLRVVIVGAGLAGLAAAVSTKLANPSHEVTILEAVHELAEVGVCYGFLLIRIFAQLY